MGFQTAVVQLAGAGVQGEVYNSGPIRALAYTLNSASAANNIFGNAFTVLASAPTQARAGNPDSAGIFAGFLINPKAASSRGTTGGGPLAPTLLLPNYDQVELLSMGMIFAFINNAANVGDNVMYDLTTGVLTSIAPGVTIPSGTAFANAQVAITSTGGAGLALIEVTAVPVAPLAP